MSLSNAQIEFFSTYKGLGGEGRPTITVGLEPPYGSFIFNDAANTFSICA
jgi:hypothetical protein